MKLREKEAQEKKDRRRALIRKTAIVRHRTVGDNSSPTPFKPQRGVIYKGRGIAPVQWFQNLFKP